MITQTSTGLIHTAKIRNDESKPAIKRGRGRPRKDASDGASKYDFSALIPKVKIPKFKGTSRTYINFGDKE